MRNFVLSAISISMILLFTTLSLADNFQDGLKASTAGDYAKAHDLWLLDAENGNPEAQYSLAHLYARGLYTTNGGLMKDIREAEKWFLEAAEHGKVEAQYDLGVLYAQGPLQDLSKAKKWFLAAAQKEHPQAQYNLGYMYATGMGVDVDFSNAEKWIRHSAMNDFPEAQFMFGGLYYEGKGVPQSKTEAYAWWFLAEGNGVPNASKATEKARTEWAQQIIKDGELRALTLSAQIAVLSTLSPEKKVFIGEYKYISSDGWYGCTNREIFEKLHDIRKENKGDNKYISSKLRSYKKSKDCMSFKSGQKVIVTDTVIPPGRVEIRQDWGGGKYWTYMNALK